MNLNWKRLGGQLGVLLALVGFVLVFLGWNGAATYNFTPAQFPYLISGGIAGLGLIVLGAALLIVQNNREERAAVLSALAEIREAIERSSMGTPLANGSGSAELLRQAEASGLVIAGSTSYHRPSCRLLDGRGALPAVPVAEARERSLTPCRACDPDTILPEPQAEPAGRRSRRRS